MIVVAGKTYLTVADAAQHLGISTRAVDDNIERGVLPQPDTVQWGSRLVNIYTEKYLNEAARRLAERAALRRRKA